MRVRASIKYGPRGATMSMMKGGESYRRAKHEEESRKTNMGCWNGNGSDAHTIIIMIQTTDSVRRLKRMSRADFALHPKHPNTYRAVFNF